MNRVSIAQTVSTPDIEDNLARAEAMIAEAGAAGAGLEDVVKTTIWLTDRADFSGFNAVYREFFPDAPPARSTVVSELVLDARVEIEAIALRPPAAE